MPSTRPLVPISSPRPAAAVAIRAAWDAGNAVYVTDPTVGTKSGPRRADFVPTVDGNVAAVVATSGTEAEPKLVELTWDGLHASADAVNNALGVTDADRWLCCLPLHSVAGLAIVARCWVAGTALTVHEGFDVDAVATSDATLVSLVPTMLRRLLDARVTLPFRHILLGGAAVPSDLLAPNVTATYGMTETWGGCVHDGVPLDNVELRIAQDGEILVRGPMLMRGYRSEEPLAPGAWFATGDIGSVDNGRLRVTDRKRDVIITGGVNVSPTAVERVLIEHPDVADVAVAGTVDDEWGECVTAYIVPATRTPVLEALRDFSRTGLPAAALPKRLIIVDQIPRTANGKVQRRLLR